jgi:L-lactate dehydrogenase (cytochrome)
MDRVWFRPRILRDVSKVDFSTKILGFDSSMPVYITATALGESTLLTPIKLMSGKLGHPEGEVTLTRAAAKQGVIQMVSRFWTAAAVSPELKL